MLLVVCTRVGTKRSSYENREFQQKLEKYYQFIRCLEQVHDSIVLYMESYDLMMAASVGLAESLYVALICFLFIYITHLDVLSNLTI